MTPTTQAMAGSDSNPKLLKHLDYLGGGDYLFAFRMLMVLFRREVSFGDSLYLWEMMWALEYDPDLYTLYEEPDSHRPKEAKRKSKSSRQCGKYERQYLRSGVCWLSSLYDKKKKTLYLILCVTLKIKYRRKQL